MPYGNLTYSSSQIGKDSEIAAKVTSVVSKSLGKPIDYICVNVNKTESLYFAGSNDPSAMVQIQAIGGNLSSIAAPLTETISSLLLIPPERIFINYTAYAGNSWAMNGRTF